MFDEFCDFQICVFTVCMMSVILILLKMGKRLMWLISELVLKDEQLQFLPSNHIISHLHKIQNVILERYPRYKQSIEFLELLQVAECLYETNIWTGWTLFSFLPIEYRQVIMSWLTRVVASFQLCALVTIMADLWVLSISCCLSSIDLI